MIITEGVKKQAELLVEEMLANGMTVSSLPDYKEILVARHDHSELDGLIPLENISSSQGVKFTIFLDRR